MRQFAIPKALSLTDRICNNSHRHPFARLAGWDRQTNHTRRKPGTRDKRAK